MSISNNMLIRLSIVTFILILPITILSSCGRKIDPSIQEANSLDSCALVSNFFRYNLSMNYLNSFEKLEGGLLITNEYDEPVKLSTVYPTEGFCLVFYFSETMFSSCFQQQLDILKEFEDSLSKNSLVLLSSFTNLRKAKVIRSSHELKFRIYNTQFLSLGVKDLNQERPFYLLINSQGQIVQACFPDLKFPALSYEFLTTSINRFNLKSGRDN